MAYRAYRAGADFERRVQRALESLGYKVVRSAGSRSPTDLVAMRRGCTVCIQCKKSGRLDPAEWDLFYRFCREAGAVPVMAQKANGGIEYYVLTGEKQGFGRSPKAPWIPKGKEDEVQIS